MKKLYNPPPKKTLTFQVESILSERLFDMAGRKGMSLSKMLRMYCEDSLFREVIEKNK